ncbi:glycosyltransferase family 2 protein [Candidatus Woesearchaeota archaeon]|nr:glycosyltransferase family 2 protein [Candidatus Woesearchaeota archaeon]
MKLSIIMPVYNEKDTLLEILSRVQAVDLASLQKEIILVDDQSKDGTRELYKCINHSNVRIFFHEVNQGKGAAIRTGLQHATGDIIMIQDADLEYNPAEYPKLLKPILDGQASVVYGSRLMHTDMKNMYWLHYLGNKFLSLATTVLYGTHITDMETCYKVMKCDVVKALKLRARRFDFEPEITAKILKSGNRILEVPITFEARAFEEGKKITWRDGVKALWYLFRYRFSD